MTNTLAGAGLPKAENTLINCTLVPFMKIFLGWESSLFLLKKELQKIDAILSSVPCEHYCIQVKIPRVLGIEEHSRDYSIDMTLQHMTKVTQGVMFIVDALSKEQCIQKEVRIEDVKPSIQTNNELKYFSQTMNQYIHFIEQHNKKVSIMTKKHPWFSEFNNKQWACFAFIHTFVHRRQLEVIVERL